ARLGLPASTSVGIVVPADEHVVDRQRCGERGIDLVDPLAPLRAAGYVGLIGYDQQQVSASLELEECAKRALDDTQLLDRRGRIGDPLAHDRFVEHSVPIQKDCGAFCYFNDSHFVAAA